MMYYLAVVYRSIVTIRTAPVALIAHIMTIIYRQVNSFNVHTSYIVTTRL